MTGQLIEFPKPRTLVKVRGSLEYVDALVVLNVDPAGAIDIAICRDDTAPADRVWLASDWTAASTQGVDEDGLDRWSRPAQTNDPVDFGDPAYAAQSDYAVYARPTDNPEAPIFYAGSISLT